MNLYKNYYKILKIEKSATNELIKAAYLNLAKKYHPDKHQNSTDAVKLFQEIAEAYDVLSNHRTLYDKHSPHFILKKDNSERLDIEITLHVKDKKDLTFTYQAYRVCKKCDQTGYNINSNSHKCRKCEGSGYGEDGYDCLKCNGTGKIYDMMCPACRGSKMVLSNLQATIENIFLFKESKKIILPNKAHRSNKVNKFGNLIVTLLWQN